MAKGAEASQGVAPRGPAWAGPREMQDDIPTRSTPVQSSGTIGSSKCDGYSAL